MNKEFDVVVIGELNMDLILAGIETFPKKGKEILAEEMTLTLGSSSAIFASNLSTLGTKVRFVGKVGRDQFGKQIQKDLLDKGIDTSKIIVSNYSKTGVTVALSYENERTMVTHAGAMKELTEEEIDNPTLQSCKHLHISSIFLQPALKDGIISLFRRARKLGLTTSMDTQWDPEEKWDCNWEQLLPLIDIFLPNMQEIKSITREDSPKACINKLKNDANTIVIKDGTAGSIAQYSGKYYTQPAFLNTKVKDTIGAGDSFDAGFIHQFIRNKHIKECLKFGSLCGAINTTAYGGTTAFSNKENIKKIAIEKFKYKINDL